jgi:vacuolar-type H+-ATPase subunit B/Vma2
MNISSIAFCLAMMFILSTLDLLGRMLNSQGKLIDSHGKLADIVGEIITDVASGIEKPDDPPQT